MRRLPLHFGHRASPLLFGLSLLAALSSCGGSDQRGVHDGPPCTPPEALAAGALGPGFVDLNVVPDADPAYFHDKADANGAPTFNGLLADLDGDGKPELITGNLSLVRYTRDPQTGLFGNRQPLSPDISFQLAVAALDLDGDGRADIVSGSTGQIAWGEAGGAFTVGPFGGQSMNSWPRALSLADLDHDGWLDLVVAGQCQSCDKECRVFWPAMRTGPRTFTAHPDWVDPTLDGGANAVLFAEFHPGEQVVALQIGSNNACAFKPPGAFYRSTALNALNEPRFVEFEPTPDNARLHTASFAEARLSDFVPMGSAIADLNADGLLDFLVVTDTERWFFQTANAWPFVERSLDACVLALRADPAKYPMLSWGTALVDVDGDGQIDMFAANGNDEGPLERLGPQYPSLHLGQGDFRFVDASVAAHLDRVGQWHALTVGDLDADGDPDFVVGGRGMVPRVFRNDIQHGGHSLALRLHGTTSNHLGAGARVWVKTLPTDSERLLVGDGMASPFALSEPLVFVGAGAATTVDSVRIVWPSGYTQMLHGVPTGQIHDVTEPQFFALDPPTRHGQSASAQPVTLTVTPRDAAGALRADAKVALTFTGTAVTPSTDSGTGGTHTFAILPPTSPGTTVVHIQIDGVELGIAPKIFWD